MKKKRFDPADRRYFIVGISTSLITASLLSMAFYFRTPGMSPPDFWNILLINSGMLFLTMAIIFIVGAIIYLTLKHIDWNAIDTAFNLLSNRLSQRIRSKNADRIAPWLRVFLFTVLSRNVEVLPLPLGKDMTCLTPYGCSNEFRSDCVFYRFQLIANDFPDLGEGDVQRLLNQFVVAELNNYGIAGLPRCYVDTNHYVWASVFIDRVIYDRLNHLISFDLLFIASEGDVNYRRKAALRDNPQPTMEAALYDDEL